MAIRLGDTAPDFTAQSTEGEIRFYEWMGNQWCVLFSHPQDYTPVCTTELASVARLQNEFARRGVRVIGLSVDGLRDHEGWSRDIEETQRVHLHFPLIADADRSVSRLYDMIHPNAGDTVTVRSVFVIDNHRKVRLVLTYPQSTGRNFAEILRTIDSLQLTTNHQVSTPADWKPGQDVIILPALSNEEAKQKYPHGWREEKPYLRYVPDPTRAMAART